MINNLNNTLAEIVIGSGEDAPEPQDATLVSSAITSTPGESSLSQPLDNTASWGTVAVLGAAILSLFIVALIDVRKKK